ncbi:MAG: RHS repeat domain-containing protein [Acidobacteriota bacterium]
MNNYCNKVDVLQQDLSGKTMQREVHYFHGAPGNPDTYFDANYYSSALEGKEYRVEKLKNVTAANPTVVSVVETTYEQRPCETTVGSAEQCPTAIGGLRASPVDTRVRKATSTLFETNKTSITEITAYDRYNNPLVTDESGFAGLYRRRTQTYLDTNNGKSYRRLLDAAGLVNESLPDAGKTIHIRNLVESETLTDMTTSPAKLVESTSYGYDAHGNAPPRQLPRQVSSAPYLDSQTPNERGNLTQVSRQLYLLSPMIPANKTLLTSYLYDDAGNIVRQVDALGNQTNIEYGSVNGSAWPTVITNALSHTVRNEYDFSTGFVKKFTDANLKDTVYGRSGDPLDRLTSVSFPDGGLTEFKYCDVGATVNNCEVGMEMNSFRKKVKQDSCGVNTVVKTDGMYDGLGRGIKQLQWESNSARILTETQYDALGRAYRVSNPTRAAQATKWTETLFDDAGRTIGKSLPDGAKQVLEPLGHQTTVMDPAGRKTLQVMDAFGRLESVTEDPGGALAFTTNYRYSVQNDLIGVCPGAAYVGAVCGAAGRERVFTYDSLRRLAKAKNPESGEIQYVYNDAGSLEKKTDANGVETVMGYDALQRPLTKTYSDGTPEVRYLWDTVFKGALTKVENSVTVREQLSFDNMGRVLTSRQTTNGTAYNFSYQYNLAGGLGQETYPSGRQVTSCYDEAGRVTQVKQKATAAGAETVVANVTQYWEHGPARQMSLGGVVSEATLFDDARLQLRRVTAGTVAAGNWEQKLHYCMGVDEMEQCLSNNGNIVKQRGYGGAEWNYSYDRLNRLEQAVETVGGAERWRQKFNFDAAGNRWILNGSGTLIPNLEATPRAGSLTDASPFTVENRWNGAQYDAGGNQKTSWGDGTAVGASQYDYDAENHLKRAAVRLTAGTTGVTEYGYDGEGRRVVRREGGVVKTVFVYNAKGEMVAEYGEGAAMLCTSCYLTADHLGSTRVVWGTDGQIKKLYDYAPYGEEVGANYRGGDERYPTLVYPRAGGQAVSIMFTGKERDAETGLDYFEARYFSGAQGRFTSPDEPLLDQSPYDPQSWNLYAYVRNNPLRYTDPTGRCSQAAGGYTDEGSGLFPGPCSGGQIGEAGAGRNSVTVGVGRDEANLFMLQGVGQQFSAHGVAQFVSDAAQATGRLTGATDVAQCLTSGITGSGCSKTGVAMAMLPGLGSSRRAIRILEEVAGAIHLEVQGARGTYQVIANISREGDTIILQGAHMQGSGAGQFGGKELLKEIREAAKQFGREQGAKEVVIQGGARTSGANPGHIPPPIRIKVQ